MKSFFSPSMASLSVLNYNLPPGLTMKLNGANNMANENASPTPPMSLKTFNKITVQNVLSENNSNALNIAQGNPNAIVRKIKDFGMIGTVNAAGNNSLNLSCNGRKRPLSENNKASPKAPKEKKVSPSVAKKPKLSKEERTALRLAKKAVKENSATAPVALANNGLPIKIPGTPGRKGLPLPQAVARRNARERNRVKQVNNGFAALRERIPEEVAEAFEAQSTCKNNGKKLSKVETLRMAVEYIRSLERLLGFDFPLTTGSHNLHSTSSSGDDSFSMIKDEFDAYSPSMDEHYEDSLSHYDSEEYFCHQSSPAATPTSTPMPATVPTPTPAQPPPTCDSPPQMDMLPNITTLNGLQYIRIPGTNTYQLLTPDIFVGTAASPPSSTVDEEHFNALIDTNCASPTSMSTLSSPTTTSSPMTMSRMTLAHVTADQPRHSISPPSITSTMARDRTEAAPVSLALTNTKCVNAAEEGSSSQRFLSSSSSTSSSSAMRTSPVPQQQQQQQQQHQQKPMISMLTTPNSTMVSRANETGTLLQGATTPAALEGLRQTCAVNQQPQQQQQRHQPLLETHLIKQEFEEPTNIIYHQQQSPINHNSPHQQHSIYMVPQTMAMSPPLDRQTPTSNASTSTSTAHSHPTHFQQFYHNHSNAQNHFFNGLVNLKKEFNEDLLDVPHNSNVISDESMIETIDWWEAHTPKSEGGSVML